MVNRNIITIVPSFKRQITLSQRKRAVYLALADQTIWNIAR